MKMRRAIAILVTIGGVVLILVFASARQRDQTETYARQYTGEQWDVARNCLLGTPIGRGQRVAEIREILRARLLSTLAQASEAEPAPAVDRLWPARCAGIFPTLRADASIFARDPGNALSMLEVLVPRVLESMPGDAQALVAVDRRIAELAEPIARLDAAMPAGGGPAPHDYPPRLESVAASDVLRSLSCASAPEENVQGAMRIELSQHGDSWRGSVCEGERCEPMPPLRAGSDLRFFARESDALFVGRARRSELVLARRLHREDGRLVFTEPVVVGRGALSASPRLFSLALCHGPRYESRDGRNWRRAE